MNPQTLLNECQNAGVNVWVKDSALKLKGSPEAAAAAVVRLRPHKDSVMRHLLKPFRFDLLKQEENRAELDRLNNMAWEFMQSDGLPFADAIKLAAEVVAACEVAACETAYDDVQQLWERLYKRALSKTLS